MQHSLRRPLLPLGLEAPSRIFLQNATQTAINIESEESEAAISSEPP